MKEYYKLVNMEVKNAETYNCMHLFEFLIHYYSFNVALLFMFKGCNQFHDQRHLQYLLSHRHYPLQTTSHLMSNQIFEPGRDLFDFLLGCHRFEEGVCLSEDPGTTEELGGGQKHQKVSAEEDPLLV